MSAGAETACDVVVVGGGGAGLAAAITAAEVGRRVVLLEKAPQLGGSTAWAIGSVTAAGTPDQRLAGVEDTPAEHLADLPAWAGPLIGRDNPALFRVLTDNAADAIAWLRESGVEFFGPLPEPPHRKPRMHVALPNSRSFVHHLSRRAQRAGVDVRLGCRVERLIERDGRIAGVAASDGNGGEARFVGARGVVLAGGDFSASPDFRREFASPEHVGIPAVNAYATGDCQQLGRAAGGIVLNGDLAFGDPRYRFAPPAAVPWWLDLPPVRPLTTLMRCALRWLPAPLVRPFAMSFLATALAPEAALLAEGALLVNIHGESFLRPDERPGFAIARQPGQAAYLLLDGELARRFSQWPNYVSTAPGVAYAYVGDYRRNRPDLCAEGGTLEQVAARRDMAPERLRASVAAHAPTRRLEAKPFLLLGPIRSYVVLADGGLKVSSRLEVLNARDEPIAGLYAAGATAQGGMLLRGHGHHLAWAFVSGRLAGRSAAGLAQST